MTSNITTDGSQPQTRELSLLILKDISSVLCRYLEIPEPDDEQLCELIENCPSPDNE